MTKFMDGLYKNSVWIVLVALMIGYLCYNILSPSIDIGTTLKDYRTWVHFIFVIVINVTMVTGAYDAGLSAGLSSEEFTLADKLNNKIIESVNNEMIGFRQFIKDLNDNELKSIREDYLFSIGDKKLEELTKKELKKYNKLKPIQHNIYGFNLPLYYTLTKNGKINYQSSIKQNDGKRIAQIKKIFVGALYGAMTINMAFSLSNVSSTLITLMIISVGLVVSFILAFFPQVFKLKYDIPKKVIIKNTLYNSYVSWKNKTHNLQKLDT